MEHPEGPKVHVEHQEHGVVVVTLDDAARKNVMTAELGERLRDALGALHEAARRGEVRAVVLTGAGGAFSSGGDLAMLDALRGQGFVANVEFMLSFYRRYLSILEVPVPVIAAVRGPAIGAGLAIALACDLLVVGNDAKLAANFVALGLHPGMGITYTLPLRVGAVRARELLLTGRRFDGREASALGLGLCADDAQVLPEALRLAQQIAQNGPLAVRACKRSLAIKGEELNAALEREAFAQAESYASEELAIGLTAAKARQKPVWP